MLLYQSSTILEKSLCQFWLRSNNSLTRLNDALFWKFFSPYAKRTWHKLKFLTKEPIYSPDNVCQKFVALPNLFIFVFFLTKFCLFFLINSLTNWGTCAWNCFPTNCDGKLRKLKIVFPRQAILKTFCVSHFYYN